MIYFKKQNKNKIFLKNSYFFKINLKNVNKIVLFLNYDLKLINFSKYYIIYFFIESIKLKNFFYYNYLWFNLKSLKTNINFFKKNKLLITAKPGLINNSTKLKEKKLKKKWKINKLLIILLINYVKYKKNFILYIKYLNNYIFKIILILKSQGLLNYSNIFCIDSKYKLLTKVKKIKSIKKKFKKLFFKKIN